jgi:hypothetical protein
MIQESLKEIRKLLRSGLHMIAVVAALGDHQGSTVFDYIGDCCAPNPFNLVR